jgi:hypothetical protein
VTGVLAVDLAAKYSAAIWLSSHRQPVRQWDTWQAGEDDFLSSITVPFRLYDEAPTALVVEDLPARVPWMSVVKDVCRLQGRIVEKMCDLGRLDRLLFVQPAQWRAHYGPAMKNGTGPAVVLPVAADHGYTPPDLLGLAGKGEKPIARKVATDYCAAFLIGKWALDTYDAEQSFDAPRTSRYTKVGAP